MSGRWVDAVPPVGGPGGGSRGAAAGDVVGELMVGPPVYKLSGLSVRYPFRSRRSLSDGSLNGRFPILPKPGRWHVPDNLSFVCGTGRGTARACRVVQHTCPPLQPIPCCV